MAFNAYETKRLEKTVGAYINKSQDQGFRITDDSVELFEQRPDKKNPQEMLELPMARATYIKAAKIWKVYWLRADRKWAGYERRPQVDSIEEFLELVEDNELGCFHG